MKFLGNFEEDLGKSDQNSKKSGYCMTAMRCPIGRTFLMTSLHPKASKDSVILLTDQTLAPCDFWLFLFLKRAVSGVRFAPDAEVRTSIKKILKEIPLQEFKKTLMVKR